MKNFSLKLAKDSLGSIASFMWRQKWLILSFGAGAFVMNVVNQHQIRKHIDRIEVIVQEGAKEAERSEILLHEVLSNLTSNTELWQSNTESLNELNTKYEENKRTLYEKKDNPYVRPSDDELIKRMSKRFNTN